MTKRERILIGGVGGLVPVLMFLITGDFDRFFSHFALGVLCGYLVRATVLFFIGGFVANLYQEETQRIKVFQLGLGAPAMIAGFLAVSPAKAPAFVIMPIAHAQAAVTGSGDLKQFTLPETSGIEEFFEGLTGAQPQHVWFVITGSFATLDNARAYAKQINDKFPRFHADVFAPYRGDTPNYSVVIGTNLTQEGAKELVRGALKAGLNSQTYYRTFAALPPKQQ